MAHDPDSIVQVQQADAEFKALMAFVRGPESRSATAFEAETHVFRALLALGVRLMAVFFAVRAEASVVARELGSPDAAPVHSWRKRTYMSVFGPLVVRRAYYWSAETGGCCPLDEELSLPARCYSDLLRDWLEFALTNDAYEQAVGLLERILGLSVAKHALERLAVEDALDVDAFYAEQPAPPTADEGPILVVQADGKGVRMTLDTENGGLRTEKKEAVVTTIYTIAPHSADVEAIADTLAGKAVEAEFVAPKQARPEPRGKRLRASLAGKDVAFDHLLSAVHKRDGPHIQHRVALTDGAQPLQQRVLDRLPDFTLILDLVHVTDYLRSGAEALLGADYPHLADFVSCRLIELLTGKFDTVLATFEEPVFLKTPTSADRAAVTTTARYLRNNADFMHYADYLAKGWPIATGVIEGACGYLVKDRMERAGMKWRLTGAQTVLDLRAVRVNGDWDDYQRFRRAHAHRRNYPSASTDTQIAEPEILACAA